MKHTLRIKWLAITLAVLAFARPVDAVTNDLNAAYKALLERDIGLIIKRGPERSDKQLIEAVICIEALEKSGDRSLLPYLEEKSLNTANPEIVRRRAAAAYVNIANVEEGVDFLRKYCDDPTVKSGKWFLVQQYLDKYGEYEKNGASEVVETHVLSVLLTIMQTTDVRDVANRINQQLLRSIPEYTNSAQRASLVRFASSGNEWVTNTFHPIKAHFDKIPPSKRIDLCKRFPDLPPLPEDKNADMPLKTTLSIGAALAAFISCCIVIWIMAKRSKTQK